MTYLHKICVPKKTKDINVKVFDIITNKNKMTKHGQNIFHVAVNVNSTTYNSNQKWNNKTCQCECKYYYNCKKDYSCNPKTCICENSNYLKSIADTWVIACDKIISVMNIVSTNMTNTIATVSLAIILLLIITIIC